MGGEYFTYYRMCRVVILLFFVCPFILIMMASPTYGQLLSPGKLSKAHANLEGITKCTSCHELGEKGVSISKCLSCHTPLKKRVDAKLGFHASAAVINQNCSNCHKEHLGRTFESIHFDTTKFEHKKTGFLLIGKHADLHCKSCHRPSFINDKSVIAFKGKYHALNKTYLGLDTTCTSCHVKDNPHGKQFIGKDCSSCHTAKTWKKVPAFNHDHTRFALVGKHMVVKCEDCHKKTVQPSGKSMVLYTGLAFQKCIDCHTDVHKGRFGTRCESCHTPKGWHVLPTLSRKHFDHTTTGFPLVGKHAVISCSSCHDPDKKIPGIRLTFIGKTTGKSFPKPKSSICLSCHVDYHDGAFTHIKGGTDCKNCHTSKAWLPTTFDITRHNKETHFKLTGSHEAIPCFSCHQSSKPNIKKPVFQFANTRCITCHRKDNPHKNTFTANKLNNTCATCHNTTSWKTSITFNHALTGFKLTGKHASITCISCHTKNTANEILFDKLTRSCNTCHRKDDPHHGQFTGTKTGASCGNCHNTDAFTTNHFDHNKARFKLDGAHKNISCGSCHKSEKAADGKMFVRYRPLSTTCKSCHGNS